MASLQIWKGAAPTMNPATNIIPLPMPKQTKMFIPPTLIEAVEHGKSIGMAENECKRFWWFYDSKSWMVGKNKMSSFKSAMAGWHLRSQEAERPTNGNVLAIQNQKALERVEERIKYLKGQMPLTDAKLKAEWNEMKTEKQRLLAALGFKI